MMTLKVCSPGLLQATYFRGPGHAESRNRSAGQRRFHDEEATPFRRLFALAERALSQSCDWIEWLEDSDPPAPYRKSGPDTRPQSYSFKVFHESICSFLMRVHRKEKEVPMSGVSKKWLFWYPSP